MWTSDHLTSGPWPASGTTSMGWHWIFDETPRQSRRSGVSSSHVQMKIDDSRIYGLLLGDVQRRYSQSWLVVILRARACRCSRHYPYNGSQHEARKGRSDNNDQNHASVAFPCRQTTAMSGVTNAVLGSTQCIQCQWHLGCLWVQ